jgi:hypothetical protein
MQHRSLDKRLTELEHLFYPEEVGFTLEELCRAIWQGRKRDFIRLARGTCFHYFVAQFEREDADALAVGRPRPRPR